MGVIQPKNTSAVVDTGGYGDRAGEYLRMGRGRYGAWIYVAFGFVLVGLLCAATVGLGVGALVGLMAGALGGGRDTVGTATIIGDAVAAAGFAVLIFHNRWRCIEAFSSRWCSGLVNLSLLYVPAVAAVYAVVRGFAKLARR